MADTAPVLVWMDDVNKSCVWLNKPWLDFTGHTTDQDTGSGWTQVVHPDDLGTWRETYDASFEARKPFAVEYRIRRHDGEYRWIIDHGIPLYEGPNGAFSGYIGSCIDITERRAAEEQKGALLDAERAARMESERVGRMKDEFLSTLSHELRTPLSAILGWSQMLTRGKSDPEQVKQGLEAIARNARAQTQIIEDLLDMSRIINGKIRLNVQSVMPGEVVESAIESILPAAEAKDVKVTKLIDPLAGPVSGDPGRLQQIVWNLLTNAIKFTPTGGKVEVLVQRVNSHVEIVVTDTGVGIAASFMPHVFERFRQVDGSTTRRHGGLGIGLSIVKQLVELHGGTVQVSSEGDNRGTTFVVALPMTVTRLSNDPEERRHPTTSANGDAQTEPPRLDGVRMLVVDDDADTRLLIQRIFQNCGAEVVVGASATEGLACLASN
jgi:PAS domain S-box-containing protein